jgi:NACalpha-BTF3-like transcription factor
MTSYLDTPFQQTKHRPGQRGSMVEAQAQAKQLDSVTDVVQEQEVDAARAQEAMSALSTNAEDAALSEVQQAAANAVTQPDIDLICSELDVTEELAIRTLREVAMELGLTKRNGDALVVAALRKLVTS